MGVRGLTTYIYNNGDRFFSCYELHGTYLVIDGNCLATILYQNSISCWSSFGGDYDRYAACIETFFELLKKCEVKPLVVFDGGYERKKLATTRSRNEGKVSALEKISPAAHSLQCYPLMMRQAFRDKLSEMGIPLAQSDFEADSEIAAVARQLDCPVLSNDSDFFIFDVKFVPLKEFPSAAKQLPDGRWCLPCRLFRLDSFLNALGGLPRPLVPLMAVLLGNDYISRFVFSNFYNQTKLVTSRKRKHIHARVRSVISWLKNQTFDEALDKILGHLRKRQKQPVALQAAQVISSYNFISSPLLAYLVDQEVQEQEMTLTADEIMDRYTHVKETDLEQELSEENLEGIDDGWTDDEEDQPNKPLEEELSEGEGQHGPPGPGETDDVASEEQERVESALVGSSKGNICEEASSDFRKESMTKNPVPTRKRNWSEMISNGGSQGGQDRLRARMPFWFIENSRKGRLPSSLTTLLTLKTYFCGPQVEEYSAAHAGMLGLNPLQRIAGILIEGDFFNYYHRTSCGYSSRRVRSMPGRVSLHGLESLSTDKRVDELCRVFQVDNRETLEQFPESWRLFVIGLVYWGNKIVSTPFTECHLHAAIFMAICVGVISDKIGFYRNRRPFMRRYASRLKQGVEDAKSSSPWEVSEGHCIRALDVLLDFFQLDEKLKTKPKLFCKSTVHSFSELQACLELLNMLNSLLLFPYHHFVVHKFYNGTFLYNIFNSFKKRLDVFTYLKNLLKDCPSVFALHEFIYKLLVPLITIKASHVGVKRKRKKKKSRPINTPILSVPEAVHDSSSEFSDDDNKFSILKKLNLDS